MASVRFRRRIIKWGNGYGIRLTKDEVERLHAAAKTTVEVEVRTEPLRLDATRLHRLNLGRDASNRHREIAEEAADAGA